MFWLPNQTGTRPAHEEFGGRVPTASGDDPENLPPARDGEPLADTSVAPPEGDATRPKHLRTERNHPRRKALPEAVSNSTVDQIFST